MERINYAVEQYLKLSVETKQLACSLILKNYYKWRNSGKRPVNLTACAFYVASLVNGEDFNQVACSTFFGTTEQSIGKNYNDLLEDY